MLEKLKGMLKDAKLFFKGVWKKAVGAVSETRRSVVSTAAGWWRWMKESNRVKHLCGGFFVGVLADGWYCGLYAGAGVGAALEYKDGAYGDKWDWTDLGMTVIGAAVGQAVRQVLGVSD